MHYGQQGYLTSAHKGSFKAITLHLALVAKPFNLKYQALASNTNVHVMNMPCVLSSNAYDWKVWSDSVSFKFREKCRVL